MKIIISILFIIAISPLSCHAIDVMVNTGYPIYFDESLSAKCALSLSIGPAHLSYERPMLRLMGQSACHIHLWGLSLQKAWRSLCIGAGWYFPSIKRTDNFDEAMWRELNKWLDKTETYHFDSYDYELNHGIGLIFSWQSTLRNLTDCLSCGFSVTGRWLRLEEVFFGYWDGRDEWCQFPNHRHFSAITARFYVRWK